MFMKYFFISLLMTALSCTATDDITPLQPETAVSLANDPHDDTLADTSGLGRVENVVPAQPPWMKCQPSGLACSTEFPCCLGACVGARCVAYHHGSPQPEDVQESLEDEQEPDFTYDDTTASDTITCVSEFSACQSDSDCCDTFCCKGACMLDCSQPFCLPLNSTCTQDGDCCNGYCGFGPGGYLCRDCVALGASGCVSPGVPCCNYSCYDLFFYDDALGHRGGCDSFH